MKLITGPKQPQQQAHAPVQQKWGSKHAKSLGNDYEIDDLDHLPVGGGISSMPYLERKMDDQIDTPVGRDGTDGVTATAVGAPLLQYTRMFFQKVH